MSFEIKVFKMFSTFPQLPLVFPSESSMFDDITGLLIDLHFFTDI